jgi:excisionase family DNA binding protein
MTSVLTKVIQGSTIMVTVAILVDGLMSDLDSKMLSTGEAAKLLGVTRQHIVDLCSRGVLPYVMAGSHRRVRRRDVLALGGRVAADRGGPMTRDQIRSLWLHRVAAGHVARAPEKSLARARRRLKALMAGEPQGRRWLSDWEALLWDGPEAVMRRMVGTDPEARELRQNSPWLSLLTATERTTTIAAFERSNPKGGTALRDPRP